MSGRPQPIMTNNSRLSRILRKKRRKAELDDGFTGIVDLYLYAVMLRSIRTGERFTDVLRVSVEMGFDDVSGHVVVRFADRKDQDFGESVAQLCW